MKPDKVDAFVKSYDFMRFDWADEETLKQNVGSEYYHDMRKQVVAYYSVMNHLCALGGVEKMYIPPTMDSRVGVRGNQELFEKQMCHDLGIVKGNRVLDIGCGRGRVALHVATHTGAEVVGINIDADQLASARTVAQTVPLCTFQMHDMNELPLPFPDACFDAIYQIQAFTYCKNLPALFRDLHRVLKPGGKLGFIDWVRLDKYDPSNAHHAKLLALTKPLIGAIGTPSPTEFVKGLTGAGFDVLLSRNASVDGKQTALIERTDYLYQKCAVFVKWLVKWKVLPAHFDTLLERLTRGGAAFAESDRLGITTSTYYLVSIKHA